MWIARGNNGAVVTYSMVVGLLLVVGGVALWGPTPASRVMAWVLMVPAVLVSGAVAWTTTRELRRRRRET